jgi:hypothetical protein
MSFVHGKDSYFSVDSDNLTTYIDSADLNQSVDMAETSTMGVEAKTYISGLSDATISIAGKYDSTASTGPDAVLAGLVGGETAVAFEYGPEGNANGKVKYSGNCFLTSYNVSAPVGDVVSFTADFQCSGAITKGTFSA